MRSKRQGILVLTLVAAQFAVMLDSSILNIALPSIAGDFGLDAIGTAWVLNAYFLTFGGLLLVSGRAADVLGRRRMMLIGAAVLIAGSILGGFAGTDTLLLIARLVQGAGAALLSPAAMSLILARFTSRARTTAMSAWGAASAAGGATGVAVGGLLTATFGWHGVLFLTGAVAAAIGVAAVVTVPGDERGTRRRFDLAGAALVTTTSVALVFAVLSASQDGLSSPQTLVAIAVAGACIVALSIVERRGPDPVLPVAAMRDVRVAAGIVVNLLGGAARVGCFVIVAMLLQQVLRFSPSLAGLAMLPTSLAGFAVSTLVLPKLLARFGPERTAVAGLALLAVAHTILSTVEPSSPYVFRVLPALLLAAAGVALSFTPTTLVIADGMAARNAGVGSGLASATAQIGGALGIAVYSALDSAQRSASLSAGATLSSAAQAGLSSALLSAAVFALLGALVAAMSFPALVPKLIRRRNSVTG